MLSLFSRALLVALVLTAVTPVAASYETITVPQVVDDTVGVRISTATTTRAARVDGVDATTAAAHRSDPTAAPIPFSMIGFELPDGVDTVRVRTAADGGGWDAWHELDRIDPEDGPDPGTDEARNDRSQRFTEPLFVGEATRFQVEVDAADAADAVGPDGDLVLEATVLDTDGLSGGPVERRRVRVSGPVAEASSGPTIISRSQWGAQAPRKAAKTATRVDMAVVHHTAGSNSYTRDQAAGQVRGIQNYHRNTLGWDDIGYNMVVDRYGRIYEGRNGGLDRAVIGAHAANYNTGSFGIAVMGNFVSVDAPGVAYDALVRAIGWKAWVHGFDPLGTTGRTWNGNPLRAVSGHKDMGNTACPGRIQDRLGWIRRESAELAQAGIRFPDVRLDSNHRPNILALADAEIVNGYPDGTYRPANPLTRGQMATIFARSMGLEPQQPDGEFTDVAVTTSHAGHITAIAAAGVVQGYPDGTFRPHQAVTRGQIASFFVDALRLRGGSSTPWSDVAPDSTHFRSIARAHEAGIVFGFSDGTYRPNRDLRRDEAATKVVRGFPPA